MKKFKSVIAFMFVPLLVLTIPFSLCFKNDLSVDEKRDLAIFPTSFTNNYFSQFDEWFIDHVPFRNQIISFYNNIDSSIENAWFNFLLKISGETSFDYPSSGSIEDITDPYLDKGQPYYAPRYNGYVIYGRDNWLFYTGDGALENYKGSDILNDFEMNKNMEKFISINDLCVSKEINVSFTVFPNKEQVYADKMPSIKVTNRAKKLQRIEHYFKKNSSLNFSYPLDMMIEKRKEKDIYLMEDTHWNSLGAMIGYSEILKNLGRSAPIYSYLPIDKQGGDLASLISSSGSVYTAYDVKYKENITYEVISDGGRRYIETKSSLNDGSRCVLIGDSYRDAIIPFAAKDYEHLTCIHYDYMDSEYTSNGISKLKAGDTLIVLSVERLYPALVKSFDYLSQHLAK